MKCDANLLMDNVYQNQLPRLGISE